MRGLILQIISGILGLWIAIRFIPEVEFVGKIQALFLAGLVLGLFNFFLKPVLKFITLPLRILTFGLFSLVINIGMIWLIDFVFDEIKIFGIWPLFLTTLIIWGIGFLINIFIPKVPKAPLRKS